MPGKETRKIFLCYRRDDSAGDTGRLHDRLALEFGDKCIFMDVDGIRLGTNFVKRLTAEVESCDALLAVIGPNWLDARDEEGNRRLDDPHDFVRIEIGAALQREIPVIPILLNGTKIPRADRLPSELQELALRSALDVRHGSFHSDVARLIADLRESGAAKALSNQETTTVAFKTEQIVRGDHYPKLEEPVVQTIAAPKPSPSTEPPSNQGRARERERRAGGGWSKTWLRLVGAAGLASAVAVGGYLLWDWSVRPSEKIPIASAETKDKLS
jgi:hypothetical protein